MKINPISVYSLYKQPQRNIIYPKQRLTQDTVSFSAKKKRTENNKKPHISTGIQMGEKIFATLLSGSTKKDVANLLKKEIPNLSIESASKITKYSLYADNYVAYFTSELNEDFSMDRNTLYIDQSPFKTKDTTERLIWALDVAHELTHFAQVKSGQEIEMYKKLAGADHKYARTITAIANMTLEGIDNSLQSKAISPYLTTQNDRMGYIKYGREIPSECPISKNGILSNLNLQNEAQVKELAEKEFMSSFVRTMDFVYNNHQNVAPEILSTISKITEDENGINELMAKTKELCCHLIENEIEARTTESILAKRILGTKKSLNIDAYTAYYELLSNSLK